MPLACYYHNYIKESRYLPSLTCKEGGTQCVEVSVVSR